MIIRPVRVRPCLLILFLLSATSVHSGETQPAAVYGSNGPLLRLATGSPGDLGLIEALALDFSQHTAARVAWYRAGSGQALAMLQAGQVDMVMVHAPDAELQAVQAGWASDRTLVGGNSYYLVGPGDDPAGVDKARDILSAFRNIAATHALFLSRGDNSGTHQRELELWSDADISPTGASSRGEWYQTGGGFMLEGLRKAHAMGAYYLTDSSTWAQYASELPDLRVLLKNDPELINQYHALIRTGDEPALRLARQFIAYLSSPEGQQLITEFGRSQYGQPLYLPARAVQH